MLFYINCGNKSSNFKDHLFKDHIYFVNLNSKDISIIFYFHDTYNKKMFLCHNLMTFTGVPFQIKLNILMEVQNLNTKHTCNYNRSS